MELPDVFNLFDLFVRFIPGSILITCLQILLQFNAKSVSAVVLLFFYISISYATGTLLYGVSKIAVTPVINKIVFGN